MYKLWFCELIQIRKFAISNLRSRRIFTLISWGTIRFLWGTICLAKSCMFLNPWNHCTSHSFTKILNVRFRLANCWISVLLLNHYIAHYSYYYTAKRLYGKAFFAKLFLCEHIVPLVGKKSVAVQHAMLVGFLALLCPHKEVQVKK